MTRDEILSVAKPILFNTEMVRAILDGRKTETRRAIKLKYDNTHIEIRKDKYGKSVIELQNDVEGETFGTNPNGSHWRKLLACIEKYPPYKKGDILYVRETWSTYCQNGKEYYIYKTHDHNRKILEEVGNVLIKWDPSIHMPKEATRIFLKVTGVRAERLQDITDEGIEREGFDGIIFAGEETGTPAIALSRYIELWNSTIPKKNRELYSWNANPWVWVVEFERVEVEE